MLWHPSYVKKLITAMAEEEVSMLLDFKTHLQT
jgi:hypothetical protein